MQAIAFMVVTDENMIQVRDASNRIEEKYTQDEAAHENAQRQPTTFETGRRLIRLNTQI
jgi:hypothetical protein